MKGCREASWRPPLSRQEALRQISSTAAQNARRCSGHVHRHELCEAVVLAQGAAGVFAAEQAAALRLRETVALNTSSCAAAAAT
jgi:hypothetical protein